MLAQTERIEYAAATDPFLDFCLWEYRPAAPAEGKYRSVNLLYQSFETAGVSPSVYRFCDELRASLGDWKTVWGIKLVDGQLSWEFYFYDYKRLEREVSIARVIDIIRRYTKCPLQVSEDNLYFMFSVDIDSDLCDGKTGMDHINIYLGDISEHVSAGICYQYTQDGFRLDNLYHFFDRERALDIIKDKIRASLHVSVGKLRLEEILIPALSRCRTIVVANKKYNDGIYFCGITVDQLILFLEMLAWPASIVESVRNHRDSLDHLLYDVGIDYHMQTDRVVYLKSSYYGVF